jgi:transcriptional regulator GlxA family with amidase domain
MSSGVSRDDIRNVRFSSWRPTDRRQHGWGNPGCYLELPSSVRPYHVDAILGRIAATLITVSDARVAIPALRPKVSAAVEHVSRHFGEKLRAEDVAQAVHVSAKQLGQEFRDSLGITAKEFITRVRINAACRLVIGAGHKLEHIAALTGFDDASHLSRVFARQRGIRPGEYRRRLQTSLL